MDINKLREVLCMERIEWRRHALERMMQRGISRYEVINALKNGEIIEEYKNDKPFESALLFYKEEKVLHIVFSFDEVSNIIYIITVYEPDTKHFHNDYKTRRNNG